MQQKSHAKTFGFIVFAILLSKVLGLVRDMMLAHYYGTSVAAQAFGVASQIPLTFFDITLGTAVASAFIPVFNGYLGEKREQRAFEFMNIFVSTVAVIATVLALLLFLFPHAAVFIMASNFSGEQLVLTEQLLRIMSPIVLIAVLAYTYVAVLQSLGEFKRPAIISALSNLALIFYFLFLNDRFDIWGLAVALVVGWLLQFLILLGPLKDKGVTFHFMLRWKDEGMKQVVLLALPVLISSWATPINKLISSNVSSYVEAGYSTMDYAYKLYFMVAGIFSLAMTNLFFPKMSRNYAAGNEQENYSLLCSLLTGITVIVLPIMLFFSLYGTDIVRIVYESGAFTAKDAAMVGSVLMAYSIGMVGLSWQEILNKYYYSGHDGKTPMVIAIVGIVLNLGISLLCLKWLGILSVGIASSISVTLMALALFWLASRKTGRIQSGFVKELLKVLTGGVVYLAVLVPLSWVLNYSDGGKLISLLKMALAFGVALLAYGAVLLVLRVQGSQALRERLSRGRR